MKTTASTMPEAVNVLKLPDGMAEIILCTDMVQETAANGEEEAVYSFNVYLLRRPWRLGLTADIAANLQAWLTIAVEQEEAQMQGVPTAALPIAQALPLLEERIAQLEEANKQLTGSMQSLSSEVFMRASKGSV